MFSPLSLSLRRFRASCASLPSECEKEAEELDNAVASSGPRALALGTLLDMPAPGALGLVTLGPLGDVRRFRGVWGHPWAGHPIPSGVREAPWGVGAPRGPLEGEEASSQ